MSERSFRIIYMPEGKSDFKEFNFSKIKLFFYFSVFLLIFIVLLGISAKYLTNIIYAHKLSILKEERDLLKEELKYLINKSDELQDDIDQLIKRDDDLRLFAGISKIDNSVRRVGVGGGNDSELELTDFYKEEEEKFNKLLFDLEKFSRIITLQRKSYESIFNNLLKNKEFTRFIPSINPVKKGRINSQFGYRVDPITGMSGSFHNGIDIAFVEKGTSVYATADGKIIKSTYSSLIGNYIKIDHNSKDFGFQTLYGHLNKRYVKVGDTVKRGDIIGEVGNTGTSTTGTHLHYEVIFKGKRIDPLDGYYDPDILLH